MMKEIKFTFYYIYITTCDCFGIFNDRPNLHSTIFILPLKAPLLHFSDERNLHSTIFILPPLL